MKHISKVKIREKLLKIITRGYYEFITIIILIFITVVISRIFDDNKLRINEYLKMDIMASVSITYILSILITLLAKELERNLEESNKLSLNYDKISKQYKGMYSNNGSITNNKLVVYKNRDDCYRLRKGKTLSSCVFAKEALDIEKNKDKIIKNDFFVYPVELLFLNINVHKISIKDSSNMYQLPALVDENYIELFKSHRFSSVFNNLNIRLKDLYIEDNKIILETERTHYYKSLVTNRAMDYELAKHLSIRQVYEYGPIVSPLKSSLLSNHIGFNGIIETADNKVIFILRSSDVSIGKKTLGTSIAASLKTKYALKNGEFDEEGLENAIIHELEDELGLKSSDLDGEMKLEKTIIGVYRDLVEGGKPQLLIYLKCKITKDEVEQKFNMLVKEDKKNKDIKRDGNKLIFIDSKDLEKIFLAPDIICTRNKNYNVMPSTSASIVLYLEYLRQLKNK